MGSTAQISASRREKIALSRAAEVLGALKARGVDAVENDAGLVSGIEHIADALADRHDVIGHVPRAA